MGEASEVRSSSPRSRSPLTSPPPSTPSPSFFLFIIILSSLLTTTPQYDSYLGEVGIWTALYALTAPALLRAAPGLLPRGTVFVGAVSPVFTYLVLRYVRALSYFRRNSAWERLSNLMRDYVGLRGAAARGACLIPLPLLQSTGQRYPSRHVVL